jgi:hypothetical protein
MTAPAFPASGSIEEHHLASVLLALLREGRDGCLTVERGGITRRLNLRGGMIVNSSSTKRADRLGEILIAQGKLTRADLKRYWQESRSGNRRLGITLVLNGVITLSDLYQAVTAQVVTILDRLQKMRSGEFSFEEGRAPAPGTVLLRIPLALYLRTDGRRRAGRPAPAGEGSAPAPVAERRGEGGVIDVGEENAGAAISFEDARRLESIGEVSFMAQELRLRLDQGPHALLGVAATAPRPAVQAAYERIAAVLGPGRLHPGCPPELIKEAGEVFRAVAAAHHALTGGLERLRQAEAPPPPQRVIQKVEEDSSRRHVALGRDLLAKRNYWQAADALRQAVRLKPDDAAYRQYLGLALMQARRLHEAEEHLVEAVRLEPSNPAHFVVLGRIYRAGRHYRKAREAFQRAQRLDPANRQAREELADLPEEQPQERRGESGILKRIFGKG